MAEREGPGHQFDRHDLFGGQDPVYLYELPMFGLGDLAARGRKGPLTRGEVLHAAQEQAQAIGATVQFSFNDLRIRVAPDTDLELLDRDLRRPSMLRAVRRGGVMGPHPQHTLTEDEALEDIKLKESDALATESFKKELGRRRENMRLLSELPPLEIDESEPANTGIETFGHILEFRIAYLAGLDWATLVQHYVDSQNLAFSEASARAMEEVDTSGIFDGSNQYMPGYFHFGFDRWKYEDDALDWLHDFRYPAEVDIATIAHLDEGFDPDAE